MFLKGLSHGISVDNMYEKVNFLPHWKDIALYTVSSHCSLISGSSNTPVNHASRSHDRSQNGGFHNKANSQDHRDKKAEVNTVCVRS